MRDTVCFVKKKLLPSYSKVNRSRLSVSYFNVLLTSKSLYQSQTKLCKIQNNLNGIYSRLLIDEKLLSRINTKDMIFTIVLWRNNSIVMQLEQLINCVTSIFFLVIVAKHNCYTSIVCVIFPQKSCKFWTLKQIS